MPTSPLVLEVCVDSLDGALTAAGAGADRLELNAALDLGGLSPSIGVTAEVVAAAGCPVVAMLRPRPGHFVYTQAEHRAMLRDAEAMLTAGVAGIAFGTLDDRGQIHRERTAELVRLIGGREAVFHRAFDILPHLDEAIELLVGSGVRRVLTSGGAEQAVDGIPVLQQLQARSAGRIELLTAAGITSSNVRRIVEQTGCRQVHGSFRESRREAPVGGLDTFRRPPPGRVSRVEVRSVRAILDALG
jgi:copper homeostasis protein